MSIGIVGLGPMGRNLAAHLVREGFDVRVFSYDFSEYEAAGLERMAHADVHSLVQSLEQPRIVLLMIKAGEPVDRVLTDLEPLLSARDVVIDGGNSHFRDTERRCDTLRRSGIHFLGTGISGGVEGARHGASIMVGGDPAAVSTARPVLEALAARVDEDRCFVEAGPGGAGHFVKMVHNGIEYGLMQLIAEIWQFADEGLRMSPVRQVDMFRAWRDGPAESFLVDVTADILNTSDDHTHGRLIDVISDRAEHKGTGRWTLEAALELGVAVPTIAAALLQRQVSASERRTASPALRDIADDRAWPPTLESALAAGMLCSFVQGFDLIAAANHEYGWETDVAAVARAWRGGCIVRAALLDRFASGASISRLEYVDSQIDAMRTFVTKSVEAGIPVPAFSASLSWLDSLQSSRLGTSLVQAQRDYFGAHGYARIDREGLFRTDWRK